MILERIAYTPLGTFGYLIAPEFMVCTVERPWANNEPRVSCIPLGKYKMVRTQFNRATPPYDTWEIVGVPGRDLIKVHKANTMNDLLGCIAPGRRFGVVADKDKSVPLDWAVIDSAGAFEEFMRAMEREPNPKTLIVRNRAGDGVVK